MYFQYNWNKLKVLKRNRIIVEKNPIHRQRGTVVVFVTLTLITIFSFAALAIDVGYLFVVRNELQNAADSAALAGANYLYGDLYKMSSVSCAQSNVTFPNWSCAESNATAAIQLNKATNTTLTNGLVEHGYWNVTGSPTGLQSTSSPHPLTNERPAVKVTISKSNGQNGGGIATFFARILGINTLDASAKAVAVGGLSPGSTKASLIPIAIPSCIYSSLYWNSTTNAPTTPPTTFSLGSTIAYTGCGGIIEAEWTSLNTGANSTTEIRNLIDYATGTAVNPDQSQLAIGSNIHIESGVHDTLYKTPQQTSVNGCSAAGDKTCEYAIIPVVSQICTNCDIPIQGFACVHILSATAGGSKKSTIDIQLVAMDSVPECKISGAGTGPNYGVYLPPKLVNYSGNTY